MSLTFGAGVYWEGMTATRKETSSKESVNNTQQFIRGESPS